MNSSSDSAVILHCMKAERRIVLAILRTLLFTSILTAIAVFSSMLAQAQEPSVRYASAKLSGRVERQASWPVEHTAGQFCIHSTVPINLFENQLPYLTKLPTELKEVLQVFISKETVHIVVMESREALDAYVRSILPSAPSRRALYIRHRGPGLVLTYFHPGWIQDVRHECTHALFELSELTLPVWQDEGLAEYFETTGDNPIRHAAHLESTRSQLRYGQVADLQKLESMDSTTGLNAKEYRDAWSVVAFLLHSSSETRATFQEYLMDLQSKRAAGFLSHRLASKGTSWRESFTDFYRRPTF